MRCPFCGNVDTQVKDSRPAEDNVAIRRRRFCPACGGRFTTYERVQLRDLVVIKSSGRREDFDRDKMARSIRIAMQKRPIESERIDQLISGIVRRLESMGETDISSKVIGEIVMETLARIDWRRSARDDQTYVRDLEWEAAHTVWIWVDLSPSMLFQSRGARTSKEERALIVAIAMADLLSHAGERVGYPGLLRPRASRNGAERLATALMGDLGHPNDDWPPLTMVRRFSEMLIVSDFLRPVEECEAFLNDVAQHGPRPHLVEVADPAEEDFPYKGRTEFLDPETGERITSGRAQDWQSDYTELRAARRDALRQRAHALGGSFTVSRTDRLASETLVRLHGLMTGNPEEVAATDAPGDSP